MDYVRLGNTGLRVSRICLGMMTYGTPTWRPWVLDEEQSRPFVKRALEHGINFFDTADMYSRGVSEEVLGRALRELGAERDQVVIATKAFFPIKDGPNARGLSRKHLFDAIDGSLTRLGHGLRRPLPDPSLRSRHANRGDPVGAARHRQGGEGPLHRRLEHGGVAVREDAARRGSPRLDPLRVDAEPLQPDLPRGGARDAPALPRGGDRRHPVEPARARVSRRQPAEGRRGATARAKTDEFAHQLYYSDDDFVVADRVGGGRGTNRRRSRRRSRSPGCSRSPASPRLSSARRRSLTWTRRWSR